jgi:hypothetical protein
VRVDHFKLPNFFVVGAMKAGTTSLYHYLRVHPQIYMCPIKEPHHFSSDLTHSSRTDGRAFLKTTMERPLQSATVSDFGDYCQLFRNVTNEIAIGECSTSYLFSSRAAKEIARLIPHAKIIMVLRHPVDRAYSQYLMDIYFGLRFSRFADELHRSDGFRRYSLAERGLYFEQVKRYVDVFPRSQLKILLYEEMQHDLIGFLKAIYTFLGVDNNWQPASLGKHNVATVPRFRQLHRVLHKLGLAEGFAKIAPPRIRLAASRLYYLRKRPRLRATERSELTKIFEADIRKLGSLIDRDLSSWLR